MFEVNLDPGEREVVQVLLDRLRDLLIADDPSLRRLFPVAHTDDDELESAYQELARGQLVEARFVAIETVESTLDAEVLHEAQLTAWMQAINSLRLVIGTLLDVTEERLELDPDDPRADSYLLYEQLGNLLGLIVWSLSGSLPEAGDDTGPGPDPSHEPDELAAAVPDDLAGLDDLAERSGPVVLDDLDDEVDDDDDDDEPPDR